VFWVILAYFNIRNTLPNSGTPCIILKGHWCDIIVTNVHAPIEDKIDDIKDRFYEELERVFDKLNEVCESVYF
jgi:hypothetical protein